LPFYVAQEKGFFNEEGIVINLKFSGNDDQVFASVINRSAAFGIGDPMFTAISREKKQNGKVVASLVDGVAIWGVTNKAIKTIIKPSDLAGLRIGTFPEPSTNYALIRKTILSNGSILKKTSIIQAAIGAQLPLLEKNAADIAMDLEPGTSIAESKGYKVVYSSAKFYGPFAFTGLTTTEDYIRSNPETVQKIVNGIEKALYYIHTEDEGTIDVAKKLFPDVDVNVLRTAIHRMIAEKTIPEHALVSDEGWQKAMRVRVEIGDLNKMHPTADAVDNSFAKNALKKK